MQNNNSTQTANPVLLSMSPVGYANTSGQYAPMTFGLIGDAGYQPAGPGGWQIVDRPKSVAATQWMDRSPYQLQFNAYISRQIPGSPPSEGPADSIESECIRLESWLDKVSGTVEPPVFSVTGPIPGVQRLWVISGLSFAEAIRHPRAGYRVQQTVNITLFEYIPPLDNKLTAYGSSPTSSFVALNTGFFNEGIGVQQYYLHTVTQAEADGGLYLINRNMYGGGANYIAAIKALNNLRDDSSLYYGMVIKMPRTSNASLGN